jgi:hypothetical protein
MKEELLKQMEIKKRESFDKGGHAEINNPHFDSIYHTAFLDGYTVAQEYIKQLLISKIELK